MNATEYQKKAARTLIDKPKFTLTRREDVMIQNVLKLAAMAGKVIDQVKKSVLHRHGLDQRLFVENMSDVAGQAAYCIQQQVAEQHMLYKFDARQGSDFMQIWNVIGLVGEAGETASLIEGMTYGYEKIPQDKLKKELGDVLWYVAGLCTRAGLDMGEVMEANITKLDLRYPNGFTEADSLARVDVVAV